MSWFRDWQDIQTDYFDYFNEDYCFLKWISVFIELCRNKLKPIINIIRESHDFFISWSVNILQADTVMSMNELMAVLFMYRDSSKAPPLCSFFCPAQTVK